MSDMLIYLYAVGGAALRTVLPSGLSGIGDSSQRQKRLSSFSSHELQAPIIASA